MPERVLILDDEPDFAAFAKAALVSVGHDVQVITESVKAPTAIEQFQPTVFILDIVMPELDGIEIVDWLARSGFGGRVILISGYGISYMEVTAKIARMKGLKLTRTLHKPVSPDQLRKAVEQTAGSGNDEA